MYLGIPVYLADTERDRIKAQIMARKRCLESEEIEILIFDGDEWKNINVKGLKAEGWQVDMPKVEM